MRKLPDQDAGVELILPPGLFEFDPELCLVTGERRNPNWTRLSQLWAKDHPCVFTGQTASEVRLVVHHIVPFHVRPDLEMDERNWLSVVEPWHLYACHAGNYQNWVEEAPLREMAAQILKSRKLFASRRYNAGHKPLQADQ